MKPINREWQPEAGMALVSKNPQHIGNAFIIKEVKVVNREECSSVFHVLTDFGNVIKLLPSEVTSLFDVAEWWSTFEHLHSFGEPLPENHRNVKQRIEKQIELLTEALSSLEE